MSGPAVTTLLSPNPASGTWVPTDNVTEATLASATAAAGCFKLRMDLNNMADGDIITLTIYTSADGTNQRLFERYTLGPNAPTELIHLGPDVPTAESIKFTALLTAGSTTSRSFPWTVLNLYGT